MERFHSRASLNVFWNETIPIPSLESAIQLLRVVTIVVVPLGGGRSARFVGNVLRVKRATNSSKLFDETFRRYGRSRIRRSSFINALLALCNTLNRRNIAPLSHRAGKPPPRNNYAVHNSRSIDFFEGETRPPAITPKPIGSTLDSSPPSLLLFCCFFSLSLCFSFLFLIVSLFFSIFLPWLGFSRLVWRSSFFFFSWNFLSYPFSVLPLLFSPFLPPSRRLICIHEKSAAVSRVKIYLSVGEEGVCDGCV